MVDVRAPIATQPSGSPAARCEWSALLHPSPRIPPGLPLHAADGRHPASILRPEAPLLEAAVASVSAGSDTDQATRRPSGDLVAWASVSDVPASSSSSAPLPPPPPAGYAPHDSPRTSPPDGPTLLPPPVARPGRVGEVSPAWRVALSIAWVLVFLAYLGVWKASEEIGIGTWWLGARSNPQPVVVRLVPFIVVAVFGAVASFPVKRLPLVSLAGALLLAAIALPDFSRASGLAVVELAIAGAVALVALASLTGRYRTPSPNVGG